MAWFTTQFYSECDGCGSLIQNHERAYLDNGYDGRADISVSGAWSKAFRLLCSRCGPRSEENREYNPPKYSGDAAKEVGHPSPRCWCGRMADHNWNYDTDGAGIHICWANFGKTIDEAPMRESVALAA